MKKEDWLYVFPPPALMFAGAAALVFSIALGNWNADSVLSEPALFVLFSISVLLSGLLVVGIVAFIMQRRSKPRALTFDEAIERLVSIYREHPQGFFLDGGGAPEQELRRIGEMLEATGGIDLMRAAHAEFSSRCNVRGAPRNLELMWDGIGRWRG